MIFDPVYWLMIGPVVLLALWAQGAVKGRFQKYSQIPVRSGVSGAEAARQMLRAGGINDVTIERAQGFLSDHYDPKTKTVRLSPAVHDGRSLAALGVACHEVGHAYQHARNYSPLVVRNALVPLSFGSNLGIIFLIIGIALNMMSLAIIGFLFFAVMVAFQLINLPVEFNASTRAKEYLATSGLVMAGPEAAGVSKVLSAAAMTYVAATAQAVVQLLYFALIIFGRRD